MLCRCDWLHGRVRHVDTQWLWVQGSSNEANFMTKFLDGEKFQETEQEIGYHCSKGRPLSARKAAPDALRRVGIGRADNGQHQNGRETREHCSSSADSVVQSELRQRGVEHE